MSAETEIATPAAATAAQGAAHGAATGAAGARRSRARALSRHVVGWLLASPLAAVLASFLVLPIATIVVVSFWGATEFSIYPAFQFDNYAFLFSSEVTYRVFLNLMTS